MRVKAVVYVTIPGTVESVRDSKLIKNLVEILEANDVEHKFVDTLLGWGCLNQDWLEFRTEVETSWMWVDFFCVSSLAKNPKEGWDWDDRKEDIRNAFHHGRLLMMVHYVRDDGTLIPHG